MGRINECYDISSKVLVEYDKFRRIISKYGIDSEQFKACIKNLKELVKNEYVMYSLLSSKEEVYDEIAKLISIDEKDLTSLQNRFASKLINIPSISNGILNDKHSLCLAELLPPSEIPSYMEFNLDDIFYYYFEIEVFLSVEELINRLRISDNTDMSKKFINKLFKLHEGYKFNLLTSRCSSEIISLYFNFDINKYPKINYSLLQKKLSDKYDYDGDYSKKYLSRKFVEMAKISIYNLSQIDNIKQDVDTYYKYLLHFSAFEYYILYLSIEDLDELDEYIDKIKMNDKKRKNSLGIRLFLAKKKIEDFK